MAEAPISTKHTFSSSLLASFLVIILVTIGPVFAKETYRTLDDTFQGDDQTSLKWAGGWFAGQNCKSCPIQPDDSSTYAKTWHQGRGGDSAGAPSLEISFEGNGIQIYGIRALNTPVNISFTFDGKPAGRYARRKETGNVTGFEYHVSYYENTSMGYGQHTLKMAVEETNNPLAVVDYVTLRFDDQRWPPKPDESSLNIGAIVGGVVGGVVALAVLAVCFVLWRRKNRRTNGDMTKVSSSGSASFEPFTMMAPAPRGGSYASLPRAEMGHHDGAVPGMGGEEKRRREHRMRSAQQTIDHLQASDRRTSASPCDADIGIQEQIRTLQDEVRDLRQQQMTAHREPVPPPLYEESTRSNVRSQRAA